MPRGSEIKQTILDLGISLEQIPTLSILKGSLIELIQNQTHIFHLDNSK